MRLTARTQSFKAAPAPVSSTAYQAPVRVTHTQPAPHVQTYMVPPPQDTAFGQPQVGPPNGGAPLVSVTVGGHSRSRKRNPSGSALKPAIYIHNRE